MNFSLAILIYLIFFIAFLWLFSKCMPLFSSLTLTALLTGIILLVLIPPSEIEDQIDRYFSNKPCYRYDNYVVLIYLLIMILTLLLISVYIILKAWQDKAKYLEGKKDFLDL